MSNLVFGIIFIILGIVCVFNGAQEIHKSKISVRGLPYKFEGRTEWDWFNDQVVITDLNGEVFAVFKSSDLPSEKKGEFFYGARIVPVEIGEGKVSP